MERNSKNDEQILIKKNKQIYQLSKEMSSLERLLKEMEVRGGQGNSNSEMSSIISKGENDHDTTTLSTILPPTQ